MIEIIWFSVDSNKLMDVNNSLKVSFWRNGLSEDINIILKDCVYLQSLDFQGLGVCIFGLYNKIMECSIVVDNFVFNMVDECMCSLIFLVLVFCENGCL